MKVWSAQPVQLATAAVALEYAIFVWLPLAPEGEATSARFANRVGLSGNYPLLFGIAVVLAVCVGKLVITIRAEPRRMATRWYILLLLGSLPLIWWFVSNDWNNEQASGSVAYYRECGLDPGDWGFNWAAWLGTPIGVLGGPTLAFWLDPTVGKRPCGWWVFVRTGMELLFVVPAWFIGWVFIEFVLLGWYWI